jgi:hypothetical protein
MTAPDGKLGQTGYEVSDSVTQRVAKHHTLCHKNAEPFRHGISFSFVLPPNLTCLTDSTSKKTKTLTSPKSLKN